MCNIYIYYFNYYYLKNPGLMALKILVSWYRSSINSSNDCNLSTRLIILKNINIFMNPIL